MEKKKLLLVAVSVGVFLVIIISAAILIFTPKNGIGTGTAFASGRPITAGTTGTLAPENVYAQPVIPPEAPPVVVPPALAPPAVVPSALGPPAVQQPPANTNTSTQESNVYISGDKPVDTGRPAGITEQSPGQVTVNITKPSAPAVPDTPPAVAKSPAPVSKPAAPAAKPAAPATKPAAPVAKPAASATAAAPKPATATAPKPPAAATPKPAAAATPKPAAAASKPAAAAAPKPASAAAPKTASTRKSDYWVQTGAFSTQVRAEGAKETLADKGITSIIENRQVDGKLWYRVRVGPYTSETEANYWLALVKSIDGFGESQVRQTLR